MVDNAAILRTFRSWRFGVITVLWLNLAFAAAAAAQSEPRQVLLLTSFELRPFTVYKELFRTELSRRLVAPVNFFEVSLQPAPFATASDEEPIVNYLRSAIAGRRLDLVVSVGGPAAAFARKYRDELFPATPVLQSGLDSRWVENQPAGVRATSVAVDLGMPEIIDNILLLRPDTTTVFVAIGASQFEDFWRGQAVREFERFKGRLTFVWWNDLSFQEMLERASALPPHSAIFYSSLSQDAKGVLQREAYALAQLRAATSAPIFGLYDFQLGGGIVGGPLTSVTDLSRTAADVAVRLLNGESPDTIKTAPLTHAPPSYDWRELRHWGISEARLPAGSIVQFRQPGVWGEYRWYILAALLLLALQTALIAGLVAQRARRRRTELELRESEERFRLMANGAPVMVWTARPDMSTDFYNSTVLQFTGLPIEELLDDGWLRRVHPDDLDSCMRSYVPAFSARKPIQMEYRFRRADGSYRWLLDTGVPRYAPDGTFAGYIGSALDITDRRQMEQSLLDNQSALRDAYEQNRDLAGRLINAQEAERTRIARDLHDDLSQQLAGVAIMLSGLKRAINKPDSQPDVERAISTLQERTSALAQTVRTLSHELHPSVLQHSGLVATLRHHCAEVAQHHQIEVMFSTGGSLDSLSPDVALCLFRVAQEALTNAVRHASAQAIDVRLSTTSDGVELTVVDDGVGFVAGERTRTGLGLRSIDERVRLTHGSVRLESQPGFGTRLLVQIPVAAMEADLIRS